MLLADEIKNNYLNALQPEVVQLNQELQSTAEVAGKLGKNIAISAKESAQEYGQYLEKTPASESIPTSLSELGKGLLAGVGGFAGDFEQLGRGIVQVLKTPEGKSKLESFIKGLEEETALYTSTDVEGMIEDKVGKTPEGAGLPKNVGLITAPIGTAIQAAKGAAKATSSAAKKMKSLSKAK